VCLSFCEPTVLYGVALVGAAGTSASRLLRVKMGWDEGLELGSSRKVAEFVLKAPPALLWALSGLFGALPFTNWTVGAKDVHLTFTCG
jgi:hypothetical protein